VYGDTTPIQLIDQDDYQLLLEMTLPPFDLETIQQEGRPCQILKIPFWATTDNDPPLPTTGVLLQIPPQGETTAHLISSDNHTLSNITLCSSHPLLAHPFYPESIISLSSAANWRGLTVARLTLTPFQWSAMTRELRYFTQIRLQVRFEHALPLFDLLRSKPEYSDNDHLWQNTILNYQRDPTVMPLTTISSSLRKTRKETMKEAIEDRLPKAAEALRLEINQTGIYRLSYQQLLEAGVLPQLINPSYFSLMRQGHEIAIKVVTAEKNQFKPDDYIEFYAESLDNLLTDTQIYWLYWRKKTPGKMIVQQDSTVDGTETIVDRFYERLHFEENQLLWAATPGSPIEDYWFWQQLDAPNSQSDGKYPVTLTIPHPDLSEPELTLRVALQGRSTAPPAPNHHTLFFFNGKNIGEQWWHGNTILVESMTIPTTLLKLKTNSLSIRVPGDVQAVLDSSYLNWLQVDYWRKLVAVDNRLTFTLPPVGKVQLTMTGLTQPSVIAYDITRPDEPIELTHLTITGENKQYQVSFTDEIVDNKTYYVTTQTLSPARMTAWKPSYLKSVKNGADYLLITAREFLPAVAPLIAQRQSQGLRAKAVSVEAIYDEFSEGLPNPVAIKNFLQYAYQYWAAPAPLYVLLFGDATLDYRGYLGRKKKNKVPPHLHRVNSSTEYVLIPDDNWYVNVAGEDVLPEMLIGRLPGDHPETVTAIVNKILDYENSPLPSLPQVLLIADEAQDFETLSDRLISWLPEEFAVDQIYALDYLAGASTTEEQTQRRQQVTDAIIAGLDRSPMITHYIGHGTIDQWWRLFKSSDLNRLMENDHLTFALMLTCINGYFSDPTRNSLAENFVAVPRKGTIASFSPSGTSYTGENDILSQKIFARIFEQGDRRLGSITTQAKIAAYAQGTSADVVRVFTLFGDPALKLRNWNQ